MGPHDSPTADHRILARADRLMIHTLKTNASRLQRDHGTSRLTHCRPAYLAPSGPVGPQDSPIADQHIMAPAGLWSLLGPRTKVHHRYIVHSDKQIGCMGTRTKVHHRYIVHSDKQIGWLVGSTPLRSINRPRRTYTRRSSTLDNTEDMEISL